MKMTKIACLYIYLYVIMLLSVDARSDEPLGLSSYQETASRITRAGLRSGMAYSLLSELCATAPHRLSGSEGAKKAVEWGRRTLESSGLERVRLEPVMVPHWVRGSVEEASMILAGRGSIERVPLHVCALGGSVGTPAEGITAEVLVVQSFEELVHRERRHEERSFSSTERSTGAFSAHSQPTGEPSISEDREQSRRQEREAWPH